MKNNILLPALIGAAAAGVLAWFLISDETADLRESLMESLEGSFDSFKEQVADTFDSIKEKAASDSNA